MLHLTPPLLWRAVGPLLAAAVFAGAGAGPAHAVDRADVVSKRLRPHPGAVDPINPCIRPYRDPVSGLRECLDLTIVLGEPTEPHIAPWPIDPYPPVPNDPIDPCGFELGVLEFDLHECLDRFMVEGKP